MQRRQLVVAGIAVWTMATSGGARAQSQTPMQTGDKAVPLNYDIDASLAYIDALSRPGATPDQSAHTPRSLGLRRVRGEFDWQATQGAGLSLVLRPDVVNRSPGNGTDAREFDDRAGDPYMQPEPTVRLLDAYQLTLHPTPGLAAAAGVFESLDAKVAAYPEVLGFGLGVLFPAKFSGIRLSFASRSTGLDTAATPSPGSAPPLFTAHVYALQGDEDRLEDLGPTPRSASTRTFDVAPVARDPYFGAATQLIWAPSNRASVSLVAGYSDANYTPTLTGGDQTTDRHNQVFGQLAAATLIPMLGRDAKLAVDGRFSKDNHTVGVANRTAFSGVATASAPVVPQIWYLAGAGYGHGDRWTLGDATHSGTVPMLGYEVETGVLAATGQNLTLQFMVSHEWRVTRDANGQTLGGFFQTNPTDATQAPLPGARSTLQRMGLQLTYRLNQNA